MGLASKKRGIKILGTGKYLPRQIVPSSKIDQEFSLIPGTIEKKSGLSKRHVADIANGESVIQMAAAAAKAAIQNANLSLSDIDCLIFAGGVAERAIPCTAALIHQALGLDQTHIPAYDINSTCISFLVAIDTLSYAIEVGQYQNVLIVAADTPSLIMNPQDMATYIIFGDGAAAAVLSKSAPHENSYLLASLMKTYSSGAPLCNLQLGISHIPRSANDYVWENYTFHMDGRGVYKMMGEIFPEFIAQLLTPLKMRLQDIDMIIPHQASNIAMQAFHDGFGVAADKIINIYPEHGNQVAASVATALHEAIVQKRIDRGANILLLGTSAGISLSGLVMTY